jgi:hypothetical protein
MESLAGDDLPPFPNDLLHRLFDLFYAYIHIPVNGESSYMVEEDILGDEGGTSQYAVLKWYIENASHYPEPIIDPSEIRPFATPVGVTMNDKGFCLDFLVFDSQEFFRTARNLAPVLQAMKAKIVTVAGDDVFAYEPGYMIRLAGGGFLN